MTRRHWFFIHLILLLAFTCWLTGCTNPDTATKTLQRQGFTEVHITGYRPFACGDDYVYQTGFNAKALNGDRVTGTVCSGLLKGNSVKLDD